MRPAYFSATRRVMGWVAISNLLARKAVGQVIARTPGKRHDRVGGVLVRLPGEAGAVGHVEIRHIPGLPVDLVRKTLAASAIADEGFRFPAVRPDARS